MLAPRFIDKPLAGVDCEGGIWSSHASVVTRLRQLDHLGDERRHFVDPFGDHRNLIRRLERMHHNAGFRHLIEAKNVDLTQIASASHSGDHRPQIVAVKAQNGSGASPAGSRSTLSRDRAQLAIGLLELSSAPIAK